MTQTTLTEVHQGIVDRLKDAFTGITVETYSPTTDFAAKAPALLVELNSFPLAKDAGDYRYPADCCFTIHCVTKKDQPLVELWEMAASVAQLIYSNGFWVSGGVMERPHTLKAHADKPRYQDQVDYESRVVSWRQTIYLGEPKPVKEGIVVKEAYLGYAPGRETPPIESYMRMRDGELPDF
ncbi:hypothetical protein VA7868_03733 [Vibrio aerogenes CECT 7868]|uniref:Uncharacterized protein n=1 Tax=Vibrio aerogenes CECT 7868 TaxID=1216006 RepID=A0A1M6B7W3_9VIBR|nr:hypothetical protein [Vibrio aerogenes]SHI44805.1 hypothetical protein VA7868_03733 [Vibrio aerogenes CECT 7868]